MKTHGIRALFLGAIVLAMQLGVPDRAAAYPVDCAILLCLSGGWPASVECASARAVFIARITPYPIEPPLQIWNCPMHASFRKESSVEKLLDVAFRQPLSLLMSPVESPSAKLFNVADQADTDISDPAFDFVRSIRVFQVQYSEYRGHDDNCSRTSAVQLGSYGMQGDFAWHRSTITAVPQASAFAPPTSCNGYWFRSIFVDWRDFQGNYGFEEVRY